jgi:hypothetical protein
MFLWVGLVGPAIGFVVGQRLIGADCQLSPTAGADMAAAFGGARDTAAASLTDALHTVLIPLNRGGLRMPTDPLTLLLLLLLAALAVAAAAWWFRERGSNQARPEPKLVEPVPVDPPHPPDPQWGRECKIAIGSAGIKSIVRNGRMEDAYQVRSASDTAFEAYADFDTQQERVALTNRLPGPGLLALSETLEARSPLSEGLGNRPPGEIWAMREEWMPTVSHFVEETALHLRAAGTWPARITADLSAGGHGVPGLYALAEIGEEFPRADRHAHFIVPEGDVERIEAIRLLDALRFGELTVGPRAEPMPWRSKLPLALTTVVRDNREGRDDLDEVAAHIGPALSARVRFETGTSENMSNLMRRLAKHGTHSDSEPCPLTFEFADTAVPIARAGGQATVDVSTLLPLADSALRALRFGEGVTHALDVGFARHLLLVTVPCNTWEDVRQVEQYVLARLEFAGPPDRQTIGVYFSGYRPDAANREERVFAIRLGAVNGGWDAVYRGVIGTHHVMRGFPTERLNGTHQERTLASRDGAGKGPEAIA